VKLALLCPLPPEKNGIANYADFFSSALIGAGVDLCSPLRGEANFTSIDEATDFVSRQDWGEIDLVHVELGGGRIREYLIIKVLRRLYPNLPITATIHDPERIIWQAVKLPWPLHKLKNNTFLYKLAILLVDPWALNDERNTAKSLAHIITLTSTGASKLQRRMRLNEGDVSVIPHGNSHVVARELPTMRPLKLLYFGFIYKGKGIEDLIAALSKAVTENPLLRENIKLTLAGGCSPEIAFGQKTNYLSELKLQIIRLGLEDLIHWELDVSDDDISDLIQQHHVVVLPYQESTKLKLLGDMRGTSGALSWAIACGRGVITSDARSFSEEVGFGNGAVYPQGNTDKLAELITMIFDEPEVISSWAEKAQAIALEREWDKVAGKFKHLFEQTLNENN